MKYRKVSTAFWVDEKVRTFSDDGRLAFLYVLTHPAMTSVGAMRGTVAGLAAELGWPVRRLERALAPAITHRMIDVNAQASYIGLPRFLRHNSPESPNVCKAWVSAIAGIPECQERTDLVQRCRAYLADAKAFREAFDEAFAKVFGDAFAQPLANPEQEPEPEQQQKQEKESSLLPPFKSAGVSNNGQGKRGRKRVDADWGRA